MAPGAGAARKDDGAETSVPSWASPRGPGASGTPDDGAPSGPAPGDGGIAGLTLPYQVVAAVALAVIGVVGLLHLGMVFLHVAPSNTMTKQHGQAVNDWIYPEFEQNWKLFAPNPLQQNIAVEARAQVRTAGRGTRVTPWFDLSAGDSEAVVGNPVPSHTRQNELRRGWDFYLSEHGDRSRPSGLRAQLSERYLRRVVVLRLDRLGQGRPQGGGAAQVILRVQVRSRTTAVAPPPWSGERVDTKPDYRTLSWWPVAIDDLSLDAAHAADTSRKAAR